MGKTPKERRMKNCRMLRGKLAPRFSYSAVPFWKAFLAASGWHCGIAMRFLLFSLKAHFWLFSNELTRCCETLLAIGPVVAIRIRFLLQRPFKSVPRKERESEVA